ncbi:MAG: flagellin, partial [Pirellulales bacterium]
TATDSALSEVSGLLTEIRAAAISVSDTVSTNLQRKAVAQQVDQSIATLVNVGNQQVRGRYLFAGTRSGDEPFRYIDSVVEYLGNEGELPGFSDLDLLFATSINGSDVFGAISEAVRGTIDLNPALRSGTPLADLHGGAGVARGSVALSDGTNTRIVDLSTAVTVGDVTRLLEANPPAGRSITATVTPMGLQIELDASGGGKLAIAEVGNGTSARDLGILEPNGMVGEPLIGDDLNPILRPTTQLNDVLGSRAATRLVSAGANNDLLIEAAENGPAYNDVAVQLVDDGLLQAAPGVTAGNETVRFDSSARAARASLALVGGNNDLLVTAVTPGTAWNNVSIDFVIAGDVKDNPTAVYTDVGGVRRLTLGIDDSDETTVAGLVAAIQATGLFTVSPDPSAGEGFDGVTPVFTANAGLVRGDTGSSGGEAGTLYINVQAGVTTANNVVAAVNAEGTFTAVTDSRDAVTPVQQGTGPVDLAATGTTSGGSGIALDRASGLRIVSDGVTYEIDLSTAETVEDLLNRIEGSGAGLSAEINASRTGIEVRSRLSGVDFSIGENGGTTATELGIRTFTDSARLEDLNKGRGVDSVDGTDFFVVRNDGTQLAIDVTGAETVGDVLDLINTHPDNQDGAAAVVARLAEFGNGIELVDDNPSGVGAGGQPNALKVIRVTTSRAAIDLGLVPDGEDQGELTSAATAPSGVVALTGTNNDLNITASLPGTAFGNTRIVLTNGAATGDQALVSYDALTATLSIDVDPSATRAATVVAAINAEGTFQASLNTDAGPNDGTGLIVDTGEAALLSSGAPERLTGADVHARETEGLFNTLLRLSEALRDGDLAEIERSLEMLDVDADRVNFSRAEVGVRQQATEVTQQRLEDEQIELKRSLSDEIDVDLAKAISDFTARQLAFQASLQTSAQLLQLTLLDFL